MSEMEKVAAAKITELFGKLPQSKQQYFIGYADGVADMAEDKRGEDVPDINDGERR